MNERIENTYTRSGRITNPTEQELKEELADEVVVAKFANTTQHGAIEGKTQTPAQSDLQSDCIEYKHL